MNMRAIAQAALHALMTDPLASDATDKAEEILREGLAEHIEPNGTEARVCADIARRQRMGVGKYGVTVEANPLSLREWLQHAYEECLDQAVYLRRAIEEMDGGAK